VSSEPSISDGARKIDAELGSVDVLVNNAAVALLAPATEYTTTDWDTTMATNLRGVFLCTREFGRGMVDRGWGRVVNIASQNAIQGIGGHVAYSAAKAGILGMSRGLAAEWGSHGVTVNCVSPTLVDTPMSRATWPDAARAQVIERIPTAAWPPLMTSPRRCSTWRVRAQAWSTATTSSSTAVRASPSDGTR